MRTMRWVVPIVIILIGIALVGWSAMVLISTDEEPGPAQDTQLRAEGPSPWEQYRDATAEQAVNSNNSGTVAEPQKVSYEDFSLEDMPQLMAGG